MTPSQDGNAALLAQGPHLSPDLDLARIHVELITGEPDTPMRWRLLRGREDAGINLDGDVATVWPEIIDRQREGWQAYVIPNAGGHTDAEITETRCLFIDADGIPLPAAWHVEPDFLVIRDNTHWHAYWRLARRRVGFTDQPALGPTEFKTAQRRLAAFYGSDPTVCNPSRVMRLAGSLHCKLPPKGDGKVRLVTIEDRNPGGTPHGADELLAGLPEVATVASVRKAIGDLQEDKPEAIRQAKFYLANRAAPVEFAGSDDACFKVAAKLYRDLGLSFETVLEMMQDWSGFDDDWLAEKIEHAAAHGQNDRGSDVPTSSQEAFGAAAAAGVTGSVEQPREAPGAPANDDALFSTGKDRRLRNPGPIEELIPGLIEKHCIAYLSGPGGLNKSRIAQHWGACIHTGTPLYGRDVERAHFVHVSYENGPDEDARRHQTLLRRLGIDPTALDDHTACDWKGRGPLVAIDEAANVEPTELWLRLETKLRSIAGHKFIVFDSTYNVFAFLGNAKINETAVQRAIDWLDNKMVLLDATGLVLTHPSHAGMERGDNSGWSVAWTNRPRVRISLKPAKDMPTSVELEVTKRNNAARRPSQTLHWIDGLMLPGNDTDQQLALYRACVRVAINAAHGGIPITNDRKQNAATYCDAVRDDCGTRPSAPELRRQLGSAAMRGELIYRPYDKNKRGEAARAGYFPPSEPRFPPA